ncbi:class I SAM-dependent methyltransferase [Paenibacillus sp. UNC451MF]|uniref:class I SAM-dependent methyltransferase n=1 Tax=Paenibacillus sp. UNC451MF TaxID=1449063 RepID=UPI0004900B39|nr:class I SAM-dependent methyltransferase [Paenibacillus sp. UNC451MF]
MNRVVQYYESFDEWGRLDREPIEFLINWHFIQTYLPKQGLILDNGAGPGKYSMKLAQAGYKVTLTDITAKLVDAARGRAQELGLDDRFEGFHTANAIALSELRDNHFDASLMLGPMYHLQQEQDQISAVKELYRVTKPGGFVFVAFMSRVRHLITSLTAPQHWKPNDTADNIASFMENGRFDHQEERRFTGAYYFQIEEIQPFMETNGFETVKLIGSSNIASLLQPDQWNYWRSRGEDEFAKILEMLKQTAENPYVLGISPHLLYIGRKQG